MSKEGIRIGGVALGFAAFGFLAVGTYSDHWHEVTQGGDNIIQASTQFEGLWNACNQQSTGDWECYTQPGRPIFSGGGTFGNNQPQVLPFHFYLFRAFAIISYIGSFIAMAFFMAGLDGVRFVKDLDRKNGKLKISAGINGLCFVLLMILLIMFRVYEFGETNPNGGFRSSNAETMGYGMWCTIGATVCVATSAVMAFLGIEERYDKGDDQGMMHGGPSHATSYI